MKIRILWTLILAVMLSVGGFAQSLKDNEFYRQMVNLKEKSQKAFDEGDYLEAKRLADESLEFKAKSDQWILDQLVAYRARSALRLVQKRLEDAGRVNAAKNFPEELKSGKALYAQAYNLFYDEKSYQESLDKSNEALKVLSVIGFVRSNVKGRLAASYRVRLLPGNTDCLWNIAGYDFVYGDPTQWRRLYEANRASFPDPSNPDLIQPGMDLKIPSQGGETRSGHWINGTIQ